MNRKFSNWYLVPFIFIMALPLLIYAIKFETGTKNYFAFLTTILLAISLKIIFKIKPFIFILISFFALFFSIIYTVQILEYDTYVNISTWATLFDSYTSEMKEFISGLKTTTIILVFFEIFIYITYLFITYRKTSINIKKKPKYVIMALLLFFFFDYLGNGATTEAFPLKSVQTLYDYLDTKRIEHNYLSIKQKTKFNIQREQAFINKKETIVIVVGEATRRDRLEYYGYDMPTTPLMKKEDLIIYTDVVSAANQTINSLKRVFTMAEFLNDEDYWKNPSFIKAFSEAGFKTYWISNQPVYGKYKSEASFIAQETDQFIATNNTSYFVKGRLSKYDGVLVDMFNKIIKNEDKKKLIFLHIMGTHSTYNYRYPKQFNFFNKQPSSNYKVNYLREYDNAVRYNDYFLHQVLSILKTQSGEKSFIMFSDHGESLFDKPDQCYHGSAEPASSEVEIPLVLWFSDEFKNNHPKILKSVLDNKNQPVLSSDFFHAFPPLFGIHFDKLKPENSFFFPTYIPKKNRKIVNVNLELRDYNSLDKKHSDIEY